MDTDRLKASFAQGRPARRRRTRRSSTATCSSARPELRDLFPTSMAAQRDKLVNALGTVVSNVDPSTSSRAFVRGLGRDHRKFGVLAEHYAPVGEALLATLAYYLGDEWTPELAADWQAAYEIVAGEMTAAARDAESTTPPWWDAPIVAHERRPGTSIAVVTVRPETALGPHAGAVGGHPGRRAGPGSGGTTRRPTRRATDNSLEFHVRARPGGTALTRAGVRHGRRRRAAARATDRLGADAVRRRAGPGPADAGRRHRPRPAAGAGRAARRRGRTAGQPRVGSRCSMVVGSPPTSTTCRR